MTRIIRKETRKRGFFGKVFMLLFWAYNALMLFWMGSYWVEIAPRMEGAGSEAARAGTAIGATLGTGVIMSFWLVGVVILGLAAMMTRGRTVIIEERAE